MMDKDDILDREISRLQSLVEHPRLPFLRRVSHSAPALITIAAMVVLFQMRNLPEQLANSSLDAAIAIERPVEAKSVRLVAIDDQDYAALFHARSPLNSKVLGQVLAAVAQGHPRAIVVDLDTSDPSFANLDPPAVPTVWDASGEQQADGKFVLDSPLGGRILPAGSAVGLAVAPQDDRGIVRGYQHTYSLEAGGEIDSPGYAAASMIMGHAPEDPASESGQTHYLDFRYRFAPVKARDLLQDAASPAWAQMRMFDGQVVVVGGTYRAARDQYATPKGMMNGCEIVAQAVAAEIDGTYIRAVNRWMTGVLMVVGGLIILAVYHWMRFRTAFAVSLIMVPVLSVAANWILFHRFAAWGAMVPLVIAVIVAELYSKATLYLGFYQRVAALKKQQPENPPAAETR